jgi:hypothetical protein
MSQFLNLNVIESELELKQEPEPEPEPNNVHKRRGRKSIVTMVNASSPIILKQHHFNYSDSFADKLSTFATAHLEDTNKEFKSAWKEWTEQNKEMIEQEISKMNGEGFEGSVEDKMYFSARYYYRKKAKKEQTEEPQQIEEEKPQRKKYECLDKVVLIQMNEHILSQIYSSADRTDGSRIAVSNMTPSKAFTNYCKTFGICEENASTKKNYKNLYWRISKRDEKIR